MPYAEIVIDADVTLHWQQIVVVGKHHPILHAQLENVTLEKVWADRIGHHDVLYQFHIKTGHFPHHHHFTVLAEVRGGHAKIINVEEGSKTLF